MLGILAPIPTLSSTVVITIRIITTEMNALSFTSIETIKITGAAAVKVVAVVAIGEEITSQTKMGRIIIRIQSPKPLRRYILSSLLKPLVSWRSGSKPYPKHQRR